MATNARLVGELTRLIVAEIRATLARKGWTQVQLSERSGVPLRTLEKILRLESALDVEQLDNIAHAFEVYPDTLVAAARSNAEIYLPDGTLNAAHTRVVKPSSESLERAARRRPKNSG